MTCKIVRGEVSFLKDWYNHISLVVSYRNFFKLSAPSYSLFCNSLVFLDHTNALRA
jgi:hypothetical protein